MMRSLLILPTPTPGAERPGRIRAARAGLAAVACKTCAKSSVKEGGVGGKRSGVVECDRLRWENVNFAGRK